MGCTGPCVVKYTLVIGEILGKIWNSPLRDILIGIAKDHPKAV
jgi:hypothetical protein